MRITTIILDTVLNAFYIFVAVLASTPFVQATEYVVFATILLNGKPQNHRLGASAGSRGRRSVKHGQ